MKKLFFFSVLMSLFSLNILAVNLVGNGDMESKGSWETAVINPGNTGVTATFGYSESGFGDNGCMYVKGGPTTHIYVYQAIDLTQGVPYDISFDYKLTAIDTWCEIHVGTTKPVEGSDSYTGTPIFSHNGASLNEAGKMNKEYIPAGSGTYYFVIKVGSWAPDTAGDNVFNLFVDNVLIEESNRVIDPNAVEKVIGGNMESGEAWTIGQVGGTALSGIEWDYAYTAGDGGNGLRIYATPPSGNGANIFLYQPVSLTAGTEYKVNGKFIQLDASANQYWMQVFVMQSTPVGDDDTNEDNSIMTMGTWNMGENQGEAKMYDFQADGRSGKNVSFASYTPSVTGTYYFVIKAGTWNGTFNFVLDDISFKDPNAVDTGVNQQSAASSNVFAEDGYIRVDAAEGFNNIAVYAISGSLLETASSATSFVSSKLNAGIYIVKVDNDVYKVSVK